MAEPAPLHGVDAAPAPEGGAAEWFAGAGGARLRAALFPATGVARGSVVVSPGRTEPIEKYFEVVETLRARGFTVLVHDWRGQGLSYRALADRSLGHASGYTNFLEDFQALLTAFEDRLPQPWIALGHSMGGCLNLLALAKGEARFGAAILTAPMLGLRTGAIPRGAAPTIAALALRFGRAEAPAIKAERAPIPFEANILTHDPVRYGRNEAIVAAHPDLALGPPTWSWLDFAFAAARELAKGPGAPAISTPVVIAAAGDERLVDNGAARRVSDRILASFYLEIPGAYHEILQETDAIQVLFWTEFDALAERLRRRRLE